MKFSVLFSAFAALAFMQPLWAQTNERGAMNCVLSSYDQTRLLVDKHQPLQLELSLANPAAFNAVNDINGAKEALRSLEKEAWKNVSAERRKEIEIQASSPPPVVTLGTAGEPVSGLVSFTISDVAGNKSQPLNGVRPLATSENRRGEITLDAEASIHLTFGVDSSYLGQLNNGVYEIRARQSSSSESGQIGFVSNPIRVTIQDNLNGLSKEEDYQRNYAYGRYFLLDQKFDRVELYAQKLLAVDSDSASAAELQGDVFFAQGKREQAEKSYKTAMERLQKKFGPDSGFKLPANKILETPYHIQDQLEALAKEKAENK